MHRMKNVKLVIKFYENPSSGSWGVPCGHTDMTKLIVVFCDFANPSNKFHKCYQRKQEIALKPDRKIYKTVDSIIV
jgi:hypothetical protein